MKHEYHIERHIPAWIEAKDFATVPFLSFSVTIPTLFLSVSASTACQPNKSIIFKAILWGKKLFEPRLLSEYCLESF
jgi:hypothetical protein